MGLATLCLLAAGGCARMQGPVSDDPALPTGGETSPGAVAVTPTDPVAVADPPALPPVMDSSDSGDAGLPAGGEVTPPVDPEAVEEPSGPPTVGALPCTPDCNDGDPCTTDTCESGSCVFTADTANDGQSCADDGDVCTSDICEDGACVHLGDAASDGLDCNDGELCTIEDVCDGGVCAGRAVPDNNVCRDDGEACTADLCLGGVCSHPPIDEGGACDGPELECQDYTCRSGVCEGEVITAMEGQTCSGDDGNECTSAVCASGLCETGTPVADGSACSEDDGNSCTDELCMAGSCVHPASAEGSSCDDGLSCTADDACSAGVCGGIDDCGVGATCVPEDNMCHERRNFYIVNTSDFGALDRNEVEGGNLGQLTMDVTSGQPVGAASTLFAPDLGSTSRDLDAFSIAPDGSYVFSVDGDDTFEGLQYTEEDLMRYDPATGQASYALRFQDHLACADGSCLSTFDVRATHVADDGEIWFVIYREDVIADGVVYPDGSVIGYQPDTGTFRQVREAFADPVDALAVDPVSGNLLVSFEGDCNTVTGVSGCEDGDVVELMGDGSYTMYLDATVLEDPALDVVALDVR